MFPIGGVALPGALLPLRVFEPRYQALLKAVEADPEFGSVLIERGSEVGGGDQRMATGCLIQVLSAEDAGDSWHIIGVGTRRFRIDRWLDDDPFPQAQVHFIDEPAAVDSDLDLAEEVRRRWQRLNDERLALWEPVLPSLHDAAEDPALFSFQVAALAPLGPLDRYSILDAHTPSERLTSLTVMLDEQISDCQQRRRIG